jgi:hypothetical protein
MASNNPVTTDGLTVKLERLARHGYAYRNDDNEVHLTLPERLPHVLSDDTVTYVCNGTERLQDIAVKMYKGLMDSPIDAVEIIAQFQEDPIVDTSIPPVANRVLMLPSLGYIQEIAYGDSLTEYPEIA